MLVEWLKGRNLDAEYQWLRWEPSALPLLKSARRLAKKKTKNEMPTTEIELQNDNFGYGAWTRLKRSLMSSSAFRYLWLKYATKDYYSAYKKIRSNWNGEYIVIDRYIFDFEVDQSLNCGVSAKEFLSLSDKTILSEMQKPEFSIFINIPARVGYERKMDGTPLEYLKDREAIYNSYICDNVFHINGEQAPLEIHREITQWLEPRMVKKDG